MAERKFLKKLRDMAAGVERAIERYRVRRKKPKELIRFITESSKRVGTDRISQIERRELSDLVADAAGAINTYKLSQEKRRETAGCFDNIGQANEKGENPEDYQRALHHYCQAMGCDPTYAVLYIHRGRVRMKLGDSEGAVADYARARELIACTDEFYELGAARLEHGDFDGAVTDFSNAIEGTIVRPAVIMVDMQPGFLGYVAEDKQKLIIASQQDVLRYCAKEDVPAARLEFSGTYGLTMDELMQAGPGLELFPKSKNDGFTNAGLHRWLKQMQRNFLIMMGVNASACVLDTAKGARERGYYVGSADDLIADRRIDYSREWYTKNSCFFDTHEMLISFIDRIRG